mmetsp:Transcript_13807/g.26008  ORF Transcript_13807/g.26008 Transcript_13807/m.26008 type:complete len:93 (+) Transcript_13807:441-719(+)
MEQNFTADKARHICRLIKAARDGNMNTLIDQTNNEATTDQAAMGQRSLVAGLWSKWWTQLSNQQDSDELCRQATKRLLLLMPKIQDLALDMP